MLIQKRIESKFDDDDFGLDLLRSDTADATVADENLHLLANRAPKTEASILANFSKLSKSEKLTLLKKESPELLGLVKDYRDTLIELRDRVNPLFQLVKEGKIPSGDGGGAERTHASIFKQKGNETEGKSFFNLPIQFFV